MHHLSDGFGFVWSGRRVIYLGYGKVLGGANWARSNYPEFEGIKQGLY